MSGQTNPEKHTPLEAELIAAWLSGGPLDQLLTRFVSQTKSRAAGLWRMVNQEVVMVGFGHVPDMTAEVVQGFREATGRVTLDKNNLGIIRAVVTDKPAIARLDPSESGLTGSASWLVRFACTSSLAIPIHDAATNQTIGVIALSTEDDIQEGDVTWHMMLRLTKSLGETQTGRAKLR